jgi:Ca-activated chloride channel family protein
LLDAEGHVGRPAVDPLRYQPDTTARGIPRTQAGASSAFAGEWLTVKVRYKQPDGDISALLAQPVRSGGRLVHLPLASAVAEFGLLLRDDDHGGARTWEALAERTARLRVPSALAADVNGFNELVETARAIAQAGRD